MKWGRPAIGLRPSTPDDIAPMYEIHRAASHDTVAQTWGPWDDQWQAEYFRQHFECATRQIIQLERQPIGFLDVAFRTDHVFLAAIEITPAHQRQGIGTTLIRGILSDAATLRLPVRLQVLKVNGKARALYERLGFVETGQTNTHLLMQK